MLRYKTYTEKTLAQGTIEDVYVAHVKDPHNFFVQLERSADILERISSQLQDYYKSQTGSVLTSLDPCTPCAALYSDGSWYRAEITEFMSKKTQRHSGFQAVVPGASIKDGHPEDQMLEVQFVDFGNTDLVSTDNVRALPPDLLSEPKLSFCCRLKDVGPLHEFWSPEHIAQFEDLVLDKSVTAVFNSYDSSTNTYVVQLMGENEENLNKQFCIQVGLNTAHSEAARENRGGDSRSVQATGDKDLQVTIRASSLPKPSRGIAKLLGVESDGHVASLLRPIKNVRFSAGENVEMTVVFVTSPGEFWCQATKFCQQNACLSEELNSEYSRLGTRDLGVRSPQPGYVCAALSGNDDTWYRATIEKISGQEVSVFFLDYGNTETVPLTSVKELKETFRSLPGQAVRCSLRGLTAAGGAWSYAAMQAFEELVIDQTFMATIVDRDSEGSYTVQLLDVVGKKDIASTFLSISSSLHMNVVENRASNKCVPALVTRATSLPKLPTLSVPTAAQVFLSWVKSPDEFYIQFSDNQSLLDTLTDGLQEFYTSTRAVPASLLQPGAVVAAKFSEDGAWYRGSVRELTEQKAVVEFVDFGNSDTVSLADLRELDSQFTHVPAQAVCCSLEGVRPLQGQTWNVDAKDFLEKLTESGAMCKIVGQKESKYLVKLEVNGKDVADEMAAPAVVRRTPEPSPAAQSRQFTHLNLTQGQYTKVYVSHSESVESFFVQLSRNMGDLDKLMAELNAQSSNIRSRSLTSPQVAMPCVAQFADDEQWYRARVLSFTAHDVDVMFVDYGNVQTSPRNTVFRLDPAFLSLPAQAIHCSLDVQEGRSADSLLKRFMEFTGEEELDLKVKQKEGSRFIVDLVKKGHSITDELKVVLGKTIDRPAAVRDVGGYSLMKTTAGQSIQAYVSFVESVSSFWVQVAGSDDQLETMQKTLSQRYASGSEPPLASLSQGQPCCALYHEDHMWYRAVVVSLHGPKVKVQFVDYGNSEFVQRENVKPISADLLGQPLLALECSLDGFESSTVEESTLATFEKMIIEKELTLTFAGGKNVKVKIGSIDVGESLRRQNSLTDAPVSQALKEPSPPSGSSDAIVAHVEEDSGVFYIQLLSAASQLEQLSARVQSLCVGAASLKGTVSKGTICCACFSADRWWYRSRVLSISGDKALVQFVDYGNSEYSPTSQLKALHPELLNTPVQAFPCRLMGLDRWTSQIASVFSTTALDVEVKVRFVGASPPFEVQISVNGRDLLQMVSKASSPSPQKPFGAGQRQSSGSPVNKQSGWSPREKHFGVSSREKQSGGYAREKHASGSPKERQLSGSREFSGSNSSRNLNGGPGASDISSAPRSPQRPGSVSSPPQVYASQTVPQGTHTAFISYVAEDGTFYLQLSKDTLSVEEMGEKLACLKKSDHPSLSPGAACAAIFKEDGAWYRALVKEVLGTNATVQFVDFGNRETCEVSGLNPLPAELLGPALAFQCQLFETGPMTAEQQEILKMSCMEKEFQVIFAGSAEPPYEVSLHEKDQNIAVTLFKSTKLRAQKVPASMAPAVVVQVEPDGRFYLQLIKEQMTLRELSRDLQAACHGEVHGPENLGVGMVCCAKSPADDCWYRVQILSEEDSMFQALLVDYGSRISTEKTSTVKLPAVFTAKPALAYECKLHAVEKWTEDQKEKFRAMTERKTVHVCFLTSRPPYDVELTRSIGLELLEGVLPPNAQEVNNQEPESKQVLEEGAPPTSDDDKTSLDDDKTSPFPPLPPQRPPKSATCVVSHVDKDGSFYLQLSSDDQVREALTEKLQEESGSPSTKVFTSPVVGSICCAKFSEDGAWYRAVVEDVDEGIVTVRFIDYGNRDTMSVDDLRNLTPYSCALPPLAYYCRLELDGCVAVKEEISKKLEEVALDQTPSVEFVDQTQQHPYTVRLILEDGSSVTDMLAGQTAVNRDLVTTDVQVMSTDEPQVSVKDRENKASAYDETVTLSLGEQVAVTVSHVVSPSLFYVQCEDHQPRLDSLADAMVEQYTSDSGDQLESLLVDQICAAQFGDDGTWYRARVTALCADTDSCELFYIDYGNTATVARSSVRALSPEFKSLPRQGAACRLAGVKCAEDVWSADLVAAFEELVNDKVLVVDVIEGDGAEMPFLVHLYSSGESVALSLLSQGLPGICTPEETVQKSHVCEQETGPMEGAALPDAKDKNENSEDEAEEAKAEILVSTSMKTPEDVDRQSEDLEATSIETLEAVDRQSEDYVLTDGDNKTRDVCHENHSKRQEAKQVDECGDGEVDLARQPEDCQPFMESTLLGDGESTEQDTTDDAGDGQQDAKDLENADGTEEMTPCQPALNFSVFGCGGADLVARVGFGDMSTDSLEISQPILQSTVLGETFSQSCDGPEKLEMPYQYSCETLEVGSEYEVVVTPGGQPDAFYITKMGSRGSLETLAEQIALEVAESNRETRGKEFTVDSPCLVQDSGLWLRGQVQTIDHDMYKVLCVDTGNILHVGRDQIVDLPARFLDIPTVSVLCALADVTPVDGSWCDSALAFFSDFIRRGPLQASVTAISPNAGVYQVVVRDKQSKDAANSMVSSFCVEPSLNSMLVELGYGEAVVGSALDVEIQLEKTIDDPDQIELFEASFSVVACQRENSIGQEDEESVEKYDTPEVGRKADVGAEEERETDSIGMEEKCEADIYARHELGPETASGNKEQTTSDEEDKEEIAMHLRISAPACINDMTSEIWGDCIEERSDDDQKVSSDRFLKNHQDVKERFSTNPTAGSDSFTVLRPSQYHSSNPGPCIAPGETKNDELSKEPNDELSYNISAESRGVAVNEELQHPFISTVSCVDVEDVAVVAIASFCSNINTAEYESIDLCDVHVSLPKADICMYEEVDLVHADVDEDQNCMPGHVLSRNHDESIIAASSHSVEIKMAEVEKYMINSSTDDEVCENSFDVTRNPMCISSEDCDKGGKELPDGQMKRHADQTYGLLEPVIVKIDGGRSQALDHVSILVDAAACQEEDHKAGENIHLNSPAILTTGVPDDGEGEEFCGSSVVATVTKSLETTTACMEKTNEDLCSEFGSSISEGVADTTFATSDVTRFVKTEMDADQQDCTLQEDIQATSDDGDDEISDKSFSLDDVECVSGKLERMAEIEHKNIEAEELEEQEEHLAELVDEQGNMFEPYDGEMGLEGWKDMENTVRPGEGENQDKLQVVWEEARRYTGYKNQEQQVVETDDNGISWQEEQDACADSERESQQEKQDTFGDCGGKSQREEQDTFRDCEREGRQETEDTCGDCKRESQQETDNFFGDCERGGQQEEQDTFGDCERERQQEGQDTFGDCEKDCQQKKERYM